MEIIYLFKITLVWLLIVCVCSYFIARIIAKRKIIRLFISLISALIIFPFPLLDEIISKYKFERLCNQYSDVYISDDAKGKTVFLKIDTEGINGVLIPIEFYREQYIDVETKNFVVSYLTLHVGSGRLVRWFGLMDTNNPLIIKNNYCRPINAPSSVGQFKELGINIIDVYDKYNGYEKK